VDDSETCFEVEKLPYELDLRSQIRIMSLFGAKSQHRKGKEGTDFHTDY
jgi:hypothetical protein